MTNEPSNPFKCFNELFNNFLWQIKRFVVSDCTIVFDAGKNYNYYADPTSTIADRN